LLSLDVVDGLERRRPPGDAKPDILRERAEPRKRAHVVTGIAGADQRLEDRSTGEGRNCRAVAWRLLGEKIRRPNAARARHHLHGDGRLAGYMTADVASEETRVEIDAATRGAGDIECDGAIDAVL